MSSPLSVAGNLEFQRSQFGTQHVRRTPREWTENRVIISHKLAPSNVFHSWVEVYLEDVWYELEAFILDREYLEKLKKINADCAGAFCGYGVAVKNFKNPVIDFDRNNTYIQSEGINQDFGVYDSPDELLREHHQEMSAVKAFVYRNVGRHLMNRNVRRIRDKRI